MHNRLTVLRHRIERVGRSHWKSEYRCTCGNTIIAIENNVKKGNTRSCGCLREEYDLNPTTKKHGMTDSKVYAAWCSMKRRCYNKNDIQYADYGGRGIRVCRRWINSFENFFKDMGEPPTKKHSLDRINVEKNYSPSNCRWSTQKEQGRNKRNTTFYTLNGKTLPAIEWAETIGLKSSENLKKRLARGWTLKDALTTPSGAVKPGPKVRVT